MVKVEDFKILSAAEEALQRLEGIYVDRVRFDLDRSNLKWAVEMAKLAFRANEARTNLRYVLQDMREELAFELECEEKIIEVE